MRTGFAACLVLLLASADASARTAASQAGRLLQQAIDSYARADFEQCAALARRAGQLTDDPRLLGRIHLHLGAAEAVLGNSEAARRSFARALRFDPTLEPEPGTFKSSTANIFRDVRLAVTGELAVTGPRRAVTVLIDGKPVGRLPLSVRLPIGSHVLEVRDRDGRFRFRKAVVLRGGAEPVQVRVPSPRQQADPVVVKRPPPARRRGRLWTWIAAGTAAAALGTAVGLGLSAEASYSDYSAAWASPQRADLQQTVEREALAANVLYAVGGGLAAVAAVLFFVEGGER